MAVALPPCTMWPSFLGSSHFPILDVKDNSCSPSKVHFLGYPLSETLACVRAPGLAAAPITALLKLSCLSASPDQMRLGPSMLPGRGTKEPSVRAQLLVQGKTLALPSMGCVALIKSLCASGRISGLFSSGGPSVRFLTRYDGEVSEPLVG